MQPPSKLVHSAASSIFSSRGRLFLIDIVLQQFVWLFSRFATFALLLLFFFICASSMMNSQDLCAFIFLV